MDRSERWNNQNSDFVITKSSPAAELMNLSSSDGVTNIRSLGKYKDRDIFVGNFSSKKDFDMTKEKTSLYYVDKDGSVGKVKDSEFIRIAEYFEEVK